MTYIGVFVGFLTTFFVLTRFLSAEEIGLARVLIDAAALFIGLAQLGTSSSIIRFYPYFRTPTSSDSSNTSNTSNSSNLSNYSNSSNGFFFWTIAVPFVGFLIFMVIYWLLRVPIQSMFIDKSPLFVDYYYMVLPLSFFMLYQTIFETNANVLMRIVWPRAVRELLLRLFLLATYLLYAFRVVSMDGFVILICLSYGLAAVCNIVYLFAHGHISLRPDWHFPDRSLVRNYLLYTLFQFTAALTTVLAPSLSSFFITSQMGLSFTGIYAIATYIAAMVSIPNRSLNAIASPQLAQTFKDGDRQATTRLLQTVATNSLLVGTFIFLLIWLNIDLIFALLPNGETYAVSKYVVGLLGLSQLLMAMFNICLSSLNYSKYYAFALIYSFTLTLSAIILNNHLIPLYGMNGAAIANLLAYALYFALTILTLGITCRIHPFEKKQIAVLLIGGAVLGMAWGIDQLHWNVWLASITKTAMWIIWGSMAIYWRISPEISGLIGGICGNIINRLHK